MEEIISTLYATAILIRSDIQSPLSTETRIPKNFITCRYFIRTIYVTKLYINFRNYYEILMDFPAFNYLFRGFRLILVEEETIDQRTKTQKILETLSQLEIN